MPFTKRAARAIPLVLALAVVPGSARAGDAPQRYVGSSLDGLQSERAEPIGIAPDGTEALVEVEATRGGTRVPASVDLRTNRATAVLPAGVSGYFYRASADLSRIAFLSYAALDPADTNATPDVYLYDRATARVTLVSRNATGGAASGTAVEWNTLGFVVSPDGSTVYYERGFIQTAKVMRFAVATGQVTMVGPGKLIGDASASTTGRTVATDTGLAVGAKFLRTKTTGGYYTTVRPSPSGDAVAIQINGQGGGDGEPSGIDIVDTTTGRRRAAVLPASWLDGGNAQPAILQLADGGRALYATVVSGQRGQYVKLDTLTGAVEPIGGTVVYDDNTQVSANHAFLLAGQYAFSIGSAPLPGTDAPIAAIPAIEYVTFLPGCSDGGFRAPRIAPSMYLREEARGLDPAKSVSVAVRITKGRGTTTVLNDFTATVGQRRNLSVGFGDFTWAITVSFDDGSKRSQTGYMASYKPIQNQWHLIGQSYTACGQQNELV